MTDHMGVAISTTGAAHRLDLLRQCVAAWDEHLPWGASLFVTVDGSKADVQIVSEAVSEWTGSVLRVGRPAYPNDRNSKPRVGVAANKNTGLEALLDDGRCTRVFLSDDDSWPLSHTAIDTHVDLLLPHSLVCWGKHRPATRGRTVASWQWPRGAVMYVEREVVERVGGFIEAFGHGGHEHVEWSRRIHQAGFTPCDFPSPRAYTEDGFMGARDLWHCEDMSKPGERVSALIHRRRALTTLTRPAEDVARAERIMVKRDGDTTFVPYRAHDNGRSSATLYPNN